MADYSNAGCVDICTAVWLYETISGGVVIYIVVWLYKTIYGGYLYRGMAVWDSLCIDETAPLAGDQGVGGDATSGGGRHDLLGFCWYRSTQVDGHDGAPSILNHIDNIGYKQKNCYKF